MLYHRKFPHKKISTRKLCEFYKRHSIRRKVITKYKSPPADSKQRYDQIHRVALAALQSAWSAKEKVVYVDEVVFTKHTMPRLDYQIKHVNQTVDEKDFYHAYVAVIAAISASTGIETTMAFGRAVKKNDFIEFLKHLRNTNGSNRIHCFMDNMKAHTAPEVKDACVPLNIVPIWNVPYMPDYQPIELVFAQVKRVYKNNKLSAFINKKEFDYKREIQRAFDSVKRQTVVNCIRHCT